MNKFKNWKVIKSPLEQWLSFKMAIIFYQLDVTMFWNSGIYHKNEYLIYYNKFPINKKIIKMWFIERKNLV